MTSPMLTVLVLAVLWLIVVLELHHIREQQIGGNEKNVLRDHHLDDVIRQIAIGMLDGVNTGLGGNASGSVAYGVGGHFLSRVMSFLDDGLDLIERHHLFAHANN